MSDIATAILCLASGVVGFYLGMVYWVLKE